MNSIYSTTWSVKFSCTFVLQVVVFDSDLLTQHFADIMLKKEVSCGPSLRALPHLWCVGLSKHRPILLCVFSPWQPYQGDITKLSPPVWGCQLNDVDLWFLRASYGTISFFFSGAVFKSEDLFTDSILSTVDQLLGGYIAALQYIYHITTVELVVTLC